MLERYWIHNENHKMKRKIIAGFMPSCNSESLIKICFLNWNLRIIVHVKFKMENIRYKI